VFAGRHSRFAAVWLLALVALAATPATSAEPKSLDELKALEARVRQTIAKMMPSVVAIRVAGGQGSGVIVTRDGYVATAGHLLNQPGEKATFVMADGQTHSGIALGLDRNLDSGLMKLDGDGPWPFAEMGSTQGLKPGEWCVGIGHPFGFQEGRPPVVRVGRVLSNQPQSLRTDCAIVAGDSGGPLVDLTGRVLGIHSRIGAMISMNYHVPIDIYRSQWERLKSRQVMNEQLPLRDSSPVKALLRPALVEAARCVVRLRSDGHDAALGTIVGPQGWIVSKASELGGAITCRLRDGRELEARLVGVDPQFDLAMLKIEAQDLPVVPWSLTQPGVGQWVASAGMHDEPLALGVAGVPARRIRAPSGILGVVLDDDPGGVKILQVLPKSAAEKAGLQPNDWITHVDGRSVANRDDAVTSVKRYRPGQSIRVGLRRGDRSMELSATLGVLDTPGAQKRERQNTMSGSLSRRRDDFPLVLQHDSVVGPGDCGGPLVDLSGKVVGINIARAGRTETYTIPSELILSRMDDLMSGRLPPENKPKAEKRRE